MTSIKVVHVAPTAFGEGGLFGGGERYPLELARALARIDDIDCELVTFGPRVADVREPSGVRVRVLRPFAHLRDHPAHPLARGLAAALRDADVVHSHHLHSTPSRIAALLGAVRGRALVVTDHGLPGHDWFGLLPRLFDRFLTVSRYSATVLGVPRERTRVIYGGADTTRFTPGAERRDGVLFVGRLTPHKGVDTLLRALPPGAALTVAGTAGHDRAPPACDYASHLRTLAADRPVQFTGPVDDETLAALYRRAAVVAVPSVERTCYGHDVGVSELLGLSTIEAMASGTPVVASRVGGLPEVVVDGATGYLVEPGDVDALRDRLWAVLDDPIAAREMGERARRRVLEQFTWDRCAHRCAEVYRQLVT